MPEPCCPWCGTTLATHAANACLDGWVLQAVFGYQRVEGEEIPAWVTSENLPAGRAHRQPIWISSASHQFYCEECGTIPRFSDDIAAAWQVVEHLLPPAGDAAWQHYVHSPLGCLVLSHLTAHEAALAVVKAALRFCLEEQP